jgi:hypothetical protein
MISEEYGAFFREMDIAFLARSSLSHEQLRSSLDDIVKRFLPTAKTRTFFQIESEKAVLERLLIDAVDRKMECGHCLQLYRSRKELGFESPSDEAMLVLPLLKHLNGSDCRSDAIAIRQVVIEEIDIYLDALLESKELLALAQE